MTEIQQTNIAVANFIIDELHKELPFGLVLNQAETEIFFTFVEGYKGDLRLPMTCKNGLTTIQVNKENVDAIYRMLSTHTEQHEEPGNSIDQFIASGGFDEASKDVFGLPEAIKQGVKEIS